MAIDVEKYRQRLIEERDRLNSEIGTVADLAQPLADDRMLDAGDVAVLEAGADIERKVASMKSDRLEQVQAALQSIDDGTYGICINCSREIDPRRLDVEPAALTCLQCQADKDNDITTPEL